MAVNRRDPKSLIRILLAVVIALAGSGCGTAAMRGEAGGMASAQQGYSQTPSEAVDADTAAPASAPAPPPPMPNYRESGVAATLMAGAKEAPGRAAPKTALAPQAAGAPEPKSSAKGSPAATSAKEVTNEGSEAGTAHPRAPLLIYRADIVLGVFEVAKGLDAVEKIAKDAEGYLVTRNDDSITVRVPAAGFESSLQLVMKLGDIQKRNLQVDDVTAEMNDLTTRLKNAEAMRARLEQLMATAKTTEEALKVEEQLGRVTGEIETIKGKLRLMSELVAFSTITVTFRPVVSDKVDSKFKLPFGWLNDLGLSKLMTL